MSKFFIMGYYGNGNFGDEVMLEALLAKLGSDNNYIVTSGNYELEYNNVDYFNMHTILSDAKTSKIKRFKSVFNTLKYIIKSIDEVYIGGGTLIKNNFSTNIIFLTVSLLCLYYKKKLNFISIGIEKLNLVNNIITKTFFLLATQIQVRDKFSLSKLNKSTFIEDLAIQKFRSLAFDKKKEKLILSPALFPDENLSEKVKYYTEFLRGRNEIVLIASQVLNHHSDIQLCEQIKKNIPCEIFLFKNTNSIKTFPYYGNIISERYHIGILSCFLNSKLILIGKSNKLTILAKELEVDLYDEISQVVLEFKKPNINGIIKE